MLSKQKLKNTDVICIYGQRGSGKSIMAKYLLLKFPKYIVFDPLGEYSRFGKVVFSLEEINPEDERIIFNPRDTPNNEETHDLVSKYVWDNLPNYCFLTDEIHMYQSKALTTNFKKVITQGRHRGIGMICVSQRFANVNQTITTQASHLFLFRLFGRDIETAKTYFGSDIEDLLRQLEEYHYIYWNTKQNNFLPCKPIDKYIASRLEP